MSQESRRLIRVDCTDCHYFEEFEADRTDTAPADELRAHGTETGHKLSLTVVGSDE